MDLVPEGVADSHRAARALLSAQLSPDAVHVSMLLRARRTAEIVAQAAGLARSSITETWRLNERHAGAFEGLTREEMIEQFGREAVKSWKHSVEVRPLQVNESDGRHPRHDPRYRNVPRDLLPAGEASSDVLDRVLPYWESAVVNDLRAGKNVLVVTHDHVIRVLMWHLRGRHEGGLSNGAIPNGVPWLLWLSPGEGLIVRAGSLPEPTASDG